MYQKTRTQFRNFLLKQKILHRPRSPKKLLESTHSSVAKKFIVPAGLIQAYRSNRSET
jgi:hypothetical protein